MSTPALYTHTTRSTGTVLTAAIYNADHVNHITNGTPSQLGGYSTNQAEMQSTTSPGTVGSESLAAALSGEIERLRFMLKRMHGGAQWYPGFNLSLTGSGAIHGLTYANNAGDATNDLDIAVGGAMDATGAYWMKLASALTKQSDAAWAVGSAAGGLDTGAVGNNDYYIWLIARSDTGVVDVLYSLSSTAPTMPANYDYKRLIGWFKRSGGAIVAFHTYEAEGGGLEFTWDAPTLDVSLTNTLTTSRRTDAVKVPLNFSVIAHLNVLVYDAAAANYANICCPDQTDAAVDGVVAPGANQGNQLFTYSWSQMKVRTSSAGLIAARSVLSTVDTYKVVTVGFNWARRP